jgi:hypothetical protein
MITRDCFLKPIRPFYEITDLVRVIIGIRRLQSYFLIQDL